MTPFIKHSVLIASLITFTMSLLVASTGHFFPEITNQITAWQVALVDPPRPHPAITLITLKPEGPGACGNTGWNRALLAQTISALSQAEAKFIAPMLPLKGPSSSACGGASADATLIEATTLSGKVIYPGSTFEPIKNHARAIGHLTPTLSQSKSTAPLGIIIAKEFSKDLHFPSPSNLVFSSLPKAPFIELPFNTILALIQNQQWLELKKLVKDKIILLHPENSKAAIDQIYLLNMTLSNSGVHPIGTVNQVLLLFLFAFLAAWIFLSFPKWKGLSVAFTLLSSFIVFAIFLQLQFGGILPWFPLTLAFMGTFLSVTFLKTHTLHSYTSAHILTLKKNISQLQKDLRLKEQISLALVESLEAVKLAEQESATQLEQLASAQTEIEATRQQLKDSEAELHRVRQEIPDAEKEAPALSPDIKCLSLECQTFGIITTDPHLLKVFADIKKATKSQNPILLLGETGTGKEVFAKAAHRLSDRAKRPFIPVNMAAIRPELFESELFGHVKGAFTGALGGKGYVEAAEGGTLFLDEMGELSLDLQAKLLRLLENHTFNRVGEAHTRQANVRILVATNRDLKHEVEQGRFREDLYYRLRSIVLFLPALRERVPEDRQRLAEYFLHQCAKQEHRGEVQLNRQALKTIMSYSWPGNIRELKQTLSQATALTETTILTKADLRLEEPESVLSPGVAPHPTPKPRQSKKVPARDDASVLAALRQHRFDMGATAQNLNCDRSTITQRLKGLGYEALVKSQGDFSVAANDLAEDESLQDIVEQKLREYEANLLPPRKRYPSVEEAIADCRRRFKNLPDRYLPSVEILIRNRFAASS